MEQVVIVDGVRSPVGRRGFLNTVGSSVESKCRIGVTQTLDLGEGSTLEVSTSATIVWARTTEVGGDESGEADDDTEDH